jgi:hypothetical protein
MGIRFTCPSGHKLHVKTFLAGKRGVCPQCGAKILIPPAEEPQQAGVATPAGLGRIDPVGSVEASVPRAGAFTDAGSQSIIIAVADSSVANATISDTPVSAPPPIVAAIPPVSANGPPLITPELPVAPQPLVVPGANGPESPAVRYVARRERNRRKQFTIAVFLLLAVIVLAGVLIWVLQRGSNSAPTEKAPPTSLYDSSLSRYVAVSFDRSLIACDTQVAT